MIEIIWKIYETDLLGYRKLEQHYKHFTTLGDAHDFITKLRCDADIEYIEIRFITGNR